MKEFGTGDIHSRGNQNKIEGTAQRKKSNHYLLKGFH